MANSNLIQLAITQLLGGLTFSLLSPFYTKEATQKVPFICRIDKRRLKRWTEYSGGEIWN